MPKSHLEQRFALALRVWGKDLPEAVREYRFAPPRRWRSDFAWPAHMLAVEIDGGMYAPGGGRHAKTGDRQKRNAYSLLGWRLLVFDAAMLKDSRACVDIVREALRGKGAAENGKVTN